MSWLFGKSSRSNLPEPTALQAQKAKQIEQLKVFNQNVSEVLRDVEYRVNFVVNGCAYAVHITLPPQFPQDKPQVKISPPAQHPWVNEHMYVVGCSSLNSFMTQSNLGKVIRQVVEEFTVHPPLVRPAPPYAAALPPPAYPLHPAGRPLPPIPPYPGYGPQTYVPGVPVPTLPSAAMPNHQQPPYSQPPAASLAATGTTSHALCMVAPALKAPTTTSMPSFQPPVNSALHQDSDISVVSGSSYASSRPYKVPDVPLSFPKLNNCSTAELRELADNEDKLLQLVMEQPELQGIAADREKMCTNNEQLAMNNLNTKPVLEEKKRLLLEKYDELNDIRHVFDEYLKKQDQLRSVYDPRMLQNNLKIAALEADEESDAVAEQFIEGTMSVKDFHQKFVEKRKLGHLRRVKEEKLTSYISQNG